MKQVQATITERVLVAKAVTVTVPDDATEEAVQQAVRDEAYSVLVSHRTGWSILESEDTQVTIDNILS